MCADAFVFLDDASRGRFRLLTGLRRVDAVPLDRVDDALNSGWAEGWHCFAWLPYEAGPGEPRVGSGEPVGLYWFAESSDLDELPTSAPGAIVGLAPDLTRDEHERAVHALQEAIASGLTYQVNYTFRMLGRLTGDPLGAYLALRAKQPAEFGVFAHLPGPAPAWILSLSPELFLNVSGTTVTARPMKGTAPVSAPREFLRTDAKNLAENVMIVDLLRNDLSRVCVPGSVDVPHLFTVEQVGQLWQLTSTVRGELAAGTTTGDLLKATFPCGSITGAPKLSSMGLIEATEGTRRGTYTGSLGVLEAGGDLTLSVAIRTFEVDADGSARLGVGSGIVADSVAADEWEESLLKGAFARPPHLKEAMRIIDGVAPLAAWHRARLAAAAESLGFEPVGDLIDREIAATPDGAWRLGLEVAPDGSSTATRTPLTAMTEPVSLVLEPAPWAPSPYSRVKSSDRAHLDLAWRSAVERGAFDAIGYDETGRVLEGGRCNVFALVDGTWVTPPTSLGLLPGTQRAAVLADPGALGSPVTEAELTVEQLLRAERIIVTNAVHGVLEAVMKETR